MLELCTLASGSSGNASVVSAGSTALLIDAGISARRIVRALRDLDYDPAALGGIFITHAHSDHIGGLPILLKQLRLPVYASSETCRQLADKMPQFSPLLHVITPGDALAMGDLSVCAFPTPHDCAGSVGSTFTDGRRRACIVTDLGHVPDSVRDAVLGSHLALVETNHDPDWLKEGPYPYYLKRRILGDHGHLSNEDGAQLCRALAEGGATRIVLGHLSAQNNSPDRALAAVHTVLTGAGIMPGADVSITVAPPDRCGERQVV